MEALLGEVVTRGLDDGRGDLGDVDALPRVGGDGAHGGAGAEADDQGAIEAVDEERREVGEAALGVHLQAVVALEFAVGVHRRHRATMDHGGDAAVHVLADEVDAVGRRADGEVDVGAAGEARHVPLREEPREREGDGGGGERALALRGRDALAARGGERGQREGRGDGGERVLRAERGEDPVAGEDRAGDGAEGVGHREPTDARGHVGAAGDALEEQRERRAHPERGEHEDGERGEGAADLAAAPRRDVLAREHEEARELIPERQRGGEAMAAKASPRESAAGPWRRAKAGVRAAPTERQTRKTASISPKA